MTRQKGYLKYEDFKAVLAEIKDIRAIDMNYAGEPLLNKDVFKMAACAESFGISTMISTNATLLDRYISEVFDSQMSNLTVCLDGASNKTHEYYRVGSDFQQIKANIAALCAEKKRRNAGKPRITLQALISRINEHEIDDIIAMGRGLGVDRVLLKTMSLGTMVDSKERTERSKEWLPSIDELSRYEMKSGFPVIKSRPWFCGWIKRAVIFWNGDVNMCCYDFNGELSVGNIFVDGFKDLWQSARYKKMRRAVVRREYELCRNCASPKEMGRVVKLTASE